MKLLQLVAGQIRLNQPLPWNVRTERGDLLLGKGLPLVSQAQVDALLERGMYVDEEEFERHRQAQAAAARHDPFDVWTAFLRRGGTLLRGATAEPRFAEGVETLAQQLGDAALRDPDIATFELAHAHRVGYPVLHSVRTACLAVLVARRLGLGRDDQRRAAAAGLTMNIAMLELQQQLCMQSHPPTEEQRAAIRRHPLAGAEVLRACGVADEAWLQAVAEHHEQADGSGYPRGSSEVCTLASILHHCDVYLAKLAPRHTRPALPVNEAARSFFIQKGGAINPIAAALVREMGMYPPGSYVKLVNGEVAIVVRRGERADTPLVYSLTNSQGMPFAEALRRDTRNERFKVHGPVAPANVLVRIDRGRLFSVD